MVYVRQEKTTYWWDGLPEEKYWVEASQWKKFGKELSCPQFDRRKKPRPDMPNGFYNLIRKVKPGDIVFHYSIPSKMFVGASMAKATYKNQEIFWKHYDERHLAKPYKVYHGWSLPLYKHRAIDALSWYDLQRDELYHQVLEWETRKKQEIRRRIKAGENQLHEPTFYSFRPSKNLLIMNKYLSKMPFDLLKRVPSLLSLANSLTSKQTKQ